MMRIRRWTHTCAVVGAALSVAAPVTAQQAGEYQRSSSGTRMLEFPNGTAIRLLLDASNLGSSELEVAEITFPVGTDPASGHRHGATEIFYVVEGVLGHVVNDEAHRLEPGMVGVVKPGDMVTHRVLSDVPVKALVLWLPGGEANRIAPYERWTPIPDR